MNRRQFISLGAALAVFPRQALAAHRKFVFKIKTKSGGIIGNIVIEAKEMANNKESLIEVFARHTGQSKEKLRKDMERNYYMSAEEAKAYGIVDHVLVASK